MASKECPLDSVFVCVSVCLWEELLAAAVRGNAQLTTLSTGLAGEASQPSLAVWVPV